MAIVIIGAVVAIGLFVAAATTGSTCIQTLSRCLQLTYRLLQIPITTIIAIIVTTTTTTVEVNVDELNKRAIAKGLVADEAGNLEFRVKATPSRALPELFGAASTISVTPYSTEVEMPFLRVPGDYQGWNPANDNTILYSKDFLPVTQALVHQAKRMEEIQVVPDLPDNIVQ